MCVLGSDTAMASVSLVQHVENVCFIMVFGFCVFVLFDWNMHIAPENTPDVEFILALKLALGSVNTNANFKFLFRNSPFRPYTPMPSLNSCLGTSPGVRNHQRRCFNLVSNSPLASVITNAEF